MAADNVACDEVAEQMQRRLVDDEIIPGDGGNMAKVLLGGKKRRRSLMPPRLSAPARCSMDCMLRYERKTSVMTFADRSGRRWASRQDFSGTAEEVGRGTHRS